MGSRGTEPPVRPVFAPDHVPYQTCAMHRTISIINSDYSAGTSKHESCVCVNERYIP